MHTTFRCLLNTRIPRECRRDFEDRYFLDALCYLAEAECVSNIGVSDFGAAPLALAQMNGFTIASNLVSFSVGRGLVPEQSLIKQFLTRRSLSFDSHDATEGVGFVYFFVR